MRPVLKPALRRIWRGPATVQIGLDPSRAVVLSGCDDDVVELLDVLDGTREPRAGSAGADHGGLLTLLSGAGLLDDAVASTAPLPGLSRTHRERLAPDLAAMSLLSGAADGGLGLLRRRRGSAVAVHGAGRVGTTVATLLAAAGVGAIHVVDGGICQPGDCAPGALPMAELGRRRDEVVGDLLASYAAEAGPPAGQLVAVVLTGAAATDPRVRDGLARERVPHLVAAVRETTGLVGAFVLPGRSACLRCLDLHRTDRDPGWPVVAAQLAAATPTTIDACDTVLATAVACWAAHEVLALIDESRRPLTVNGSLELSMNDWRWRRRTWSPHPDCACTEPAV
ncbi:MAG: thiamine biosynthesis protein ThiF [Streptosporangiales bacterium]|nr:thiamine biosynthesis protein ThiF [Streptosporangiales bacterium]